MTEASADEEAETRDPSSTAKLVLICPYYEAIRALIAQLSCLNCQITHINTSSNNHLN